MVTTSYSLQSLLVIRERKSQQSKGEFARAMNVLKREEATLGVLQNKLATIKQATLNRKDNYFERVGSGSINVAQLGYMESHIRALNQSTAQAALKVQQQEYIKERAKNTMSEAQTHMVKADQDLKAIEKHKNKWQTKLQQELQRKEEETLDEIAQTKFAQHLMTR